MIVPYLPRDFSFAADLPLHASGQLGELGALHAVVGEAGILVAAFLRGI